MIKLTSVNAGKQMAGKMIKKAYCEHAFKCQDRPVSTNTVLTGSLEFSGDMIPSSSVKEWWCSKDLGFFGFGSTHSCTFSAPLD